MRSPNGLSLLTVLIKLHFSLTYRLFNDFNSDNNCIKFKSQQISVFFNEYFSNPVKNNCSFSSHYLCDRLWLEYLAHIEWSSQSIKVDQCVQKNVALNKKLVKRWLQKRPSRRPLCFCDGYFFVDVNVASDVCFGSNHRERKFIHAVASPPRWPAIKRISHKLLSIIIFPQSTYIITEELRHWKRREWR